jgi:hypothetical protein
MKDKFLNSLSGVFLIGSLFAFLAGIWWFLRGYLAPSACLDFGGAFDYSNWTCKSYDLEFEYAPAMIYFTSHFWALVLSFAIFLWCFRLRHWLMLYKKIDRRKRQDESGGMSDLNLIVLSSLFVDKTCEPAIESVIRVAAILPGVVSRVALVVWQVD